MIRQYTLTLPAFPRGFHIITNHVENAVTELQTVNAGLLHVFIQHTSAALTINENADPTVRTDLEAHFNQLAPEDAPYYQHTYEGPDDMPAHIKASLLSANITVPVSQGRLALGTWQGIILCEGRDHAGPRQLVLTLHT